MLTRRAFFASLAALAVAPRVAPPGWCVVSMDAPPLMTAEEFRCHLYGGHRGGGKSLALDTNHWPPRRDDGDTLLELR